ncbi:MAG: flavin reductase family protein [Desulfobacterales bacterium]
MKKSMGAKTLIFPTPVWIVGSYDTDGRPNGMTAAWGGICCSKPPCVYVSLQKPRYSYANIMARQAYTLSVPSEKYAREADYFGIVSGRTIDKFAATGLTPVKSEVVDAPYIAEFPLILECKLVQTIDLGLHTQFIGEVLDVKADEEVLAESGLPDIEKVAPIVFGPEIRSYHGIGRYLGRAFDIGKKI